MLSVGRMNTDSWKERPQTPVGMSNVAWMSRCDGSWNVSVKLLPTWPYCTSIRNRSLKTCWSLAFQMGDGPVSQPKVPNVLSTAFWRYAVSSGRVSDASRALRTLAPHVFWKLNLLFVVGA